MQRLCAESRCRRHRRAAPTRRSGTARLISLTPKVGPRPIRVATRLYDLTPEPWCHLPPPALAPPAITAVAMGVEGRAWQRHDLGQFRERVGLVRNRIGSNEMLLEFRLDRGFDLRDLAHNALDLTPCCDVAQRNPRAGSGGIPR